MPRAKIRHSPGLSSPPLPQHRENHDLENHDLLDFHGKRELDENKNRFYDKHTFLHHYILRRRSCPPTKAARRVSHTYPQRRVGGTSLGYPLTQAAIITPYEQALHGAKPQISVVPLRVDQSNASTPTTFLATPHMTTSLPPAATSPSPPSHAAVGMDLSPRRLPSLYFPHLLSCARGEQTGGDGGRDLHRAGAGTDPPTKPGR